MAKVSNSVSFTKAFVNLEENTITEVTKDATSTYSLSDTIHRFNGKMVSLTIKEDGELPLAEEE